MLLNVDVGVVIPIVLVFPEFLLIFCAAAVRRRRNLNFRSKNGRFQPQYF